MVPGNRYILLLVLLACWIAAVVLLITGAELLLVPLSEDPFVPLGTLLTWAGLIAMPLLIWLGTSGFHPVRGRFYRLYARLLAGLCVLAASWGLVSYGLSGNWAFTFSAASDTFRGSPEASPYFWKYTYLVALAPLAYLFAFSLHHWIWKRRQAKLSKKKGSPEKKLRTE